MRSPKKGFVYIFSNESIQFKGLVKVGFTDRDPRERAKTLSSRTGVIGKFKMEWAQEVPFMALAEEVLHYKFHPFHEQKEFFRLPVSEAIKIATEVLESLFKPINKKGIQELQKDLEKMDKLIAQLNKIPPKIKKSEIGLDLDQEIKVPTAWDTVIKKVRYPFGRMALELCLREGKKGDPIRKRFVSYRRDFFEMNDIQLYFQRDCIKLVVLTNSDSARNIIQQKFAKHLSQIELKKWAYGFSFKIYTSAQFKILVKFLSMGTKPKDLYDTVIFK